MQQVNRGVRSAGGYGSGSMSMPLVPYTAENGLVSLPSPVVLLHLQQQQDHTDRTSRRPNDAAQALQT